MNLPTREGDRYCEVCGYRRKRMADHHECGHAPCPKCGQMLLRRMDETCGKCRRGQ